jgi:hypothetical protein
MNNNLENNVRYMNIIHAGGDIDGNHYSNSFESIMHNININKDNNITIEIDILKIKDSFIIAHNGLEHIYGYNGNFKNITFDEFNKLKVYKKYTPMNFYLLKEIVKNNKNVKFNLDIKESKNDYADVLIYIKSIFDDIDNLIPQIYEHDDMLKCLEFGFKNCMIGMWKYYDDIYSQESFDFIVSIQKYDINITGFSIDYKHKSINKFKIIKNMIKSNIYLHFHKVEKYTNIDEDCDFIENITDEFNDDKVYLFL